mmetsp:Transcript_12107/g.26985  ORF Transcript_12107/g.26985 Transcript_12107/m.26985 type:complete len:210 (+) Transcript_12107:825-1454(+)
MGASSQVRGFDRSLGADTLSEGWPNRWQSGRAKSRRCCSSVYACLCRSLCISACWSSLSHFLSTARAPATILFFSASTAAMRACLSCSAALWSLSCASLFTPNRCSSSALKANSRFRRCARSWDIFRMICARPFSCSRSSPVRCFLVAASRWYSSSKRPLLDSAWLTSSRHLSHTCRMSTGVLCHRISAVLTLKEKPVSSQAVQDWNCS